MGKEKWVQSRDTLLNSYGMLFFSNDWRFATLILAVSFLNPYSGLAGLVALCLSIASARLMGFTAEQVRSGLHTYSALLVGLGMGTFYDLGTAFWVLLAVAALLSTLLSAVLIGWLGRLKLPALSLGFILTMWLVVLTAERFSTVGLTERNIYWLNEMYASGGSGLVRIVQGMEALGWPPYLSGFLRSMSAIVFQDNLLAGMLLTAGLLLHSRIALTLMILGYASALAFITVMGGYAPGINHYNLGTNFMLASSAIGGFYLIPSARSFLWTVALVPVSQLLVVGLWQVTAAWGLPVYSLPFCLTVIVFLYTLQLTASNGSLVITPVQFYRPEENLYRYISGRDRLLHRHFMIPLQLPFLGEWTVGQGYHGERTHRGDWAHALDFDIRDGSGRTYREPGAEPSDFLCHGKPVLSPGDGIVQAVIDQVDDNPVGRSNTRENWGNTIVIRHADGLYTKLCHLLKSGIRVSPGDAVRRGEIIGICGSSGRSPEPHLHFQAQSTPHVGSRTMPYPFVHYLEHEGGRPRLQSFTVPSHGVRVSHPTSDALFREAFSLQPGLRMRVHAKGREAEEWEVCVSPWNESYIRIVGGRDFAYFLNDGIVFRFTNYFGRRDSLLRHFYRAAYKVLLSTDRPVRVEDRFPLMDMRGAYLRWLQDLAAPFRLFIRMDYISENNGGGFPGAVEATVMAEGLTRVFGRVRDRYHASLSLREGRIAGFEIRSSEGTIQATCEA